MSHRSDMTKLIKAAAKRGCLVERTNNGHWRITTPSGDVVIAGFSPTTANGVRLTKQRLIKYGVRF